MAERFTVPASADPEWLYYRIQLDAVDVGDRTLTEFVRPVIAKLRGSVPDLRWFFLRFLDATGFHLRLRLSADQAGLDLAERVLDKELTAARASYLKPLYTPEWHKFGAGEGIRLAEQLFQAGSELALCCVGESTPGTRAGLAAAHLLDLITILPTSAQEVFLHQYAWYWTGGPAGLSPAAGLGATQRDATARARSARLLAHARRTLAAPGPGEALRGYGERFRTALRGRDRRLVPRTDYFLLFHHLHLTNNRLGVFPRAEATIAGMLWLALRAEKESV